MQKIMMVTAALLALGVGSAFAGDGDVPAQPPAASTLAAHTAGEGADLAQHRTFPAGMAGTTDVYSLFGMGGFAQGGER